jgi:hypothetical protein
MNIMNYRGRVSSVCEREREREGKKEREGENEGKVDNLLGSIFPTATPVGVEPRAIFGPHCLVSRFVILIESSIETVINERPCTAIADT